LKWTDYEKAESVEEAVRLLAAGGGSARAMAGGTDLLPKARGGVFETTLIVDVKAIPELNVLSYDPGKGLTLGAAVPCYKIYSDAEVSAAYPGLMDAAELIGGIQIQGRASIGGNLCNAVPSADSIPALIALGATANIEGPDGSRQVAVEDFCTGPSRNVLEPGELLISLHIPPPRPGFGARYMRFIPRNEMDIAVVGVGASVELNNGTFRSARIALASVAPTPLFVKEAGDALAGKPVSDDSIALAAQIARDAASPITDMRGTIEFRKHITGVLTRRAINGAVARAHGGN